MELAGLVRSEGVGDVRQHVFQGGSGCEKLGNNGRSILVVVMFRLVIFQNKMSMGCPSLLGRSRVAHKPYAVQWYLGTVR